jgi:DNA-binding MarR family transcriptional regulator
MTSLETSGDLEEVAQVFAKRRKELERLLVVRLATLRQIMQRSAASTLWRETGLNDFDWLVLSFIGTHDRPIMSEVSDLLRRDKGQVSRAVARLTRAGLLKRDHLRAPLVLTELGGELAARIERILRERNAALLDGLDIEARMILDASLDKLFASANALLAEERGLVDSGVGAELRAADRTGRGRDTWRSAPGQADPHSPDWMAMPDLYVLLRMLRQSATLAHGRVTGLSSFDWQTIIHIEVDGPITLADLILTIDRNKSQVGRAVARLVDMGLVERRKEPGVASVVLKATQSGTAAYDLILAESLRRDAVLTAELTEEENGGMSALLERLTKNALALLAREQEIAASEMRSRRFQLDTITE